MTDIEPVSNPPLDGNCDLRDSDNTQVAAVQQPTFAGTTVTQRQNQSRIVNTPPTGVPGGIYQPLPNDLQQPSSLSGRVHAGTRTSFCDRFKAALKGMLKWGTGGAVTGGILGVVVGGGAVAVGGKVGSGVGAVIGTILFPGIGTIAGAAIGAAIGLAVGGLVVGGLKRAITESSLNNQVKRGLNSHSKLACKLYEKARSGLQAASKDETKLAKDRLAETVDAGLKLIENNETLQRLRPEAVREAVNRFVGGLLLSCSTDPNDLSQLDPQGVLDLDAQAVLQLAPEARARQIVTAVVSSMAANARRAASAAVPSPRPQPMNLDYGLDVDPFVDGFLARIARKLNEVARQLSNNNADALIGLANAAYVRRGADFVPNNKTTAGQIKSAMKLVGGHDNLNLTFHSRSRHKAKSETDQSIQLNEIAELANDGDANSAMSHIDKETDGLVTDVEAIELRNRNCAGLPTHRIYIDVAPGKRRKVAKALINRLFSDDVDDVTQSMVSSLKVWAEHKNRNDGLVLMLHVPDHENALEAMQPFLRQIGALQQDDALSDAFQQDNPAPRIQVSDRDGDSLKGVSVMPVPDSGRSPGYWISTKAAEIYAEQYFETEGQVNRDDFASAMTEQILNFGATGLGLGRE